jgi:hypothetical protein
MNPVWRQQKLKEYCAERGIHIMAYSPLGGRGRVGNNTVMDCEVLKEIAAAKGKSFAQVIFLALFYISFLYNITLGFLQVTQLAQVFIIIFLKLNTFGRPDFNLLSTSNGMINEMLLISWANLLLTTVDKLIWLNLITEWPA